jgi:hypothetical protein
MGLKGIDKKLFSRPQLNQRLFSGVTGALLREEYHLPLLALSAFS